VPAQAQQLDGARSWTKNAASGNNNQVFVVNDRRFVLMRHRLHRKSFTIATAIRRRTSKGGLGLRRSSVFKVVLNRPGARAASQKGNREETGNH
jgi:hypothetical protein